VALLEEFPFVVGVVEVRLSQRGQSIDQRSVHRPTDRKHRRIS
jgi:hypothetical protein